MVTYLDFNATAPIEEEVLDFMNHIYRYDFGNANSRTHIYGNRAKEIVFNARKVVANFLNVNEMDVVFTSGATESNNIAVLGMLDYANKTGKNHFITTAIEHKSVLEPMRYLQRSGCAVDFIDPEETGRIDVNKILERINDRTAMVSVMHVNSETGIIQPIQEIGEFLAEQDTLFHVDATQSFGKMSEELRNTQYDFLSASSHKIRGPQGVGVLIHKERKSSAKELKPLMLGGGQEYGLRSGTVPVALVAGLGKAVELCAEKNAERRIKCTQIKKDFLRAISETKYQINGAMEYCVPNTINISFEGVDSESVFVALKNTYAFSNGSACESTGKYKESYVLSAMGLDEKRKAEALRISWDYDTKVNFDKLIEYVIGQQEE